MGLAHSAEAMSVVAEAAGVTASFNTLPIAATANMIGLAGDGSPLRSILADASKVGPQALGDALVRGVALGYNPRKMAKMAMRDGLGKSYTRMELVARTESLRSYREAARQNYILNSDIIRGYRRRCARSARTCIACIALDGTEYPLDVPFEEHPNGRCVAIPILRSGQGAPMGETAREWFERQPEKTQLEMMGPGRLELWQNKQIGWGDLATVDHDPVWGGTPKATPVGVLANAEQ